MNDLLTKADAAKYLGIHRDTLSAWEAKKEGPPSVMVNGRKRYLTADIEAWKAGLK